MPFQTHMIVFDLWNKPLIFFKSYILFLFFFKVLFLIYLASTVHINKCHCEYARIIGKVVVTGQDTQCIYTLKRVHFKFKPKTINQFNPQENK